MFVPHENDPFRPPDWRWERAKWLRVHGKYLRKDREDTFVRVAMAYQTDETRARNEIDREALSYKYPGIFNARWQLEGYLLGRASAEQTAVYTGIDPETVIWYERLFYNVLPHLEHDTYITSVVMGSSIHHGLLERDFALL